MPDSPGKRGCPSINSAITQPVDQTSRKRKEKYMKVLGTPTREQIRTMNPNYMEHKFPQIKPHPFNKIHRGRGVVQASILPSHNRSTKHLEKEKKSIC
jgi:hypothetical protein